MIINANLNTVKNRLEYTKSNTLTQKTQKIQNQQQPTSFKGGAIGGFIGYFVADVIAIVMGVGYTDKGVRKVRLKDAKEFGLIAIEKNHKDKMSEINGLTAYIIHDLKSKGNKKYQKIAEKLEKSYEKNFEKPLNTASIKLPLEKISKSNKENFITLQESIKSLFAEMNDQDRYTAIASPFRKTLQKAEKELEKLDADKLNHAPSVSKTLKPTEGRTSLLSQI